MITDFNWQVIWDSSDELLQGLLLTVEITGLAFAIAAILGLPLALGGASGSPLLRVPASAAIAVARGFPLLIVLFWLYYAAAEQGLFSLGPSTAAVLAIGLTGAGYMAEVYRSAFLAVPDGQREAAAAIGLSRRQAFGLIILPQASRTAVPPMMNLFVMFLKGATLISVIGVADMFYVAKLAAVNEFSPFELYTAAAVLIIGVTLLAASVAGLAERWLSRGYR